MHHYHAVWTLHPEHLKLREHGRYAYRDTLRVFCLPRLENQSASEVSSFQADVQARMRTIDEVSRTSVVPACRGIFYRLRRRASRKRLNDQVRERLGTAETWRCGRLSCRQHHDIWTAGVCAQDLGSRVWWTAQELHGSRVAGEKGQ